MDNQIFQLQLLSAFPLHFLPPFRFKQWPEVAVPVQSQFRKQTTCHRRNGRWGRGGKWQNSSQQQQDGIGIEWWVNMQILARNKIIEKH
jgi:hypothetical protein